LNLSRNTVRKVLRTEATAFEYERTEQPRPKLGPYVEPLEALLAEDAQRPRREQRTAVMLYEELQRGGFAGGYDTLYQSSQGWHEGEHRVLPWWEYFLGVMLLTAYREFEHRAGLVQAPRGAKRQMVLDAVAHLPGHFQYADVERACPGVSRPTINRVLADLRKEGQIQCIKPGRNAVWEKT